MKSTVLLTVVLLGCAAPAPTDQWLQLDRVEQWSSRTPITISNPYDVKLEDVPVIVHLEELELPDVDFNPGNFYVYNHQAEKTPLFQVDVPGNTDLQEIVFLASLEPGQQRTYYIYYAENGQAWPQQERYTQATGMPGWESELFGYRSYGPLALDLFARKNDFHELMLHRFYNAGNRQIYNYHEATKFGIDMMLIGSTSGLAGVGLHRADTTALIRAPFTSEVIVSGPVRSIIRMQMKPWESELGTVSVSRTATIYAHHYETQIEDHVTGTGEDILYAVGIRKEEISEIDFDAGQGFFLQWQNQGAGIGEAGIGLYIKPEYIEQVAEDKENRFILVQPPVQEPLRFWAFGAWKQGEEVDDLAAFRQRAERIRQLQLPVRINIDETQKFETE